jgi:hypothetical protein
MNLGQKCWQTTILGKGGGRGGRDFWRLPIQGGVLDGVLDVGIGNRP